MMQFLVVLIAAAACAAVFYLLVRPQWAFVLVIVLFPVEQLLHVYVPWLGRHTMVVNIVVFFLALSAVLIRSIRREPVTAGYFNRGTVLTLALYALWAAGIVYSPLRDFAIDEWRSAFPYQVLLLVLLPMLVQDVYEYRRMLTGLMLVSTIVALMIMFNPHSSYYTGRLVLDLGMIGGGVTNVGNPLATASMGATAALIAALLRPERPSLALTALRVAAFIVGMGIAIGSGSRGQVLAAGIAGILFYPVSRKLANPKQFLLVAFGFLTLVAGMYMVFKIFIVAENEQRWNPMGMLRDTLIRLDMVWVLFDYYLAHPMRWVPGLGTNAFASITPDMHGRYVHNIAAEILCEHGIIGAVLFLLIILVTIKEGRRLWTAYKDDPSMRATIAILMATCLFALLEALKQGTMSFPAPFFWWMVLTKLGCYESKLAPAASAYDEDQALAIQEQSDQSPQAEGVGPDGSPDYALEY